MSKRKKAKVKEKEQREQKERKGQKNQTECKEQKLQKEQGNQKERGAQKDQKNQQDQKEPRNQKDPKDQKKLRKEQKKNRWSEVIYNCPYLLAVMATSLIVMLYSDEIGIRAVAREAETAVVQAMGADFFPQGMSPGPNTDHVDEETADPEILNENEQGKSENAGECKEENTENQIADDLNQADENEETLENTEEEVTGITEFEFYEPQETDSRYYSDAGKVALTTEYPYRMENNSYFKDAAFLGDSRTLGISDYAGLDMADFYCDSGMTIFKLLEPDGVTYQKTGEKVDLAQVLREKHYGKIYIMLGMNELGYGNTGMYLEQYREVVDQIREWQPESIIYIMANLHVSREKNNMETEFNNININDKNAASAQLANGTDIFYLDANPLFTDEEGFLNAELSFDGVHLYAQHYDVWRKFLLEHAVEPEDGQ